MTQTLFLLRHGQASYGAANYDQLSELGAEQCRRFGQYLRDTDHAIDTVISGGLKRHNQSADAAGLVTHSTDARFTEFNMDDVIAGAVKNRPELAELVGKRDRLAMLLTIAMTDWAQDKIEVTESWGAYVGRVKSGLDELADHAGTSLVVTSGGTIAAACALSLGLSVEAQLDVFLRLYNSSVSEMTLTSRGWKISSLNSLPHLSGSDAKGLRTYV